MDADDRPVMSLAARRVVADSQIAPYTDAERSKERGIRPSTSQPRAAKPAAPVRGPMAEAMEKLAAAIGVEIVWPDDRNPTADELRALPATERLEAELTRCQDELDRYGVGRASGLGWEHRRLMVKVAERQVRWGWTRDKVVANMSDACMCYGDGKVFCAAVISDGVEIEPSFWVYCPCQRGDALRASHGLAARQAQERRSHEIESAIFDLGGDDFAEYAAVSLDSYRDRVSIYPSRVARAGRALVTDLHNNWLASDEPWWLVLYGPTGTGKTGLAVSLLKLLASRGKRGLIVREKSMLDRIRATYNRQRGSDDPTETDVLDELRRVPVLVIDDVAAPGSTTTDWAQGQLFDVLNARYSARRRTIFTTNLEAVEGDDMAVYLGPRIWSRVVERTNQRAWIRRVSEPDLRVRG